MRPASSLESSFTPIGPPLPADSPKNRSMEPGAIPRSGETAPAPAHAERIPEAVPGVHALGPLRLVSFPDGVGSQENDLGALTRRASYQNFGADLAGALPHAEQSPVAAVRAQIGVERESPPVVSHGKAHAARSVCASHSQGPRRRVLDRVGDGFLADPE